MLKKDKNEKDANKNFILWGLGVLMLMLIIALIIKGACTKCKEDKNNEQIKENNVSEVNPGNCIVVNIKDKQTAQQELITACKKYICSASEEIQCDASECCWFYYSEGACQKAVCYMR